MDILNFVIDALKEHPLTFLFAPFFVTVMGYAYVDDRKLIFKTVTGAVVASLLLVCFAHSQHAQIQWTAGVWQALGFILLFIAVALHFYLKRDRQKIRDKFDSLKPS